MPSIVVPATSRFRSSLFEVQQDDYGGEQSQAVGATGTPSCINCILHSLNVHIKSCQILTTSRGSIFARSRRPRQQDPAKSTPDEEDDRSLEGEEPLSDDDDDGVSEWQA